MSVALLTQSSSERDMSAEIRISIRVEAGNIEKTRYESYLRLYEKACQIKLWELK